MFGAYQAGVWKALAPIVKPDIVVGASVGALNGWAIASRCDPDDLIERWLHRDMAAMMRFQVPFRPAGVFAARNLELGVRRLYREFRPVSRYGAVVVELPHLASHLVETPSLTAEHLLASCAIPGGFPPRRIDRRMYCDGALLEGAPVWAARQMGATHIISVNVMPSLPFGMIQAMFGAFGSRPQIQDNVISITPSRSLGCVTSMASWNRSRIAEWIEHGRQDASSVMRDFSPSLAA
jgi:predicted acylesterase/phospholipase RssA